MNARNSASAGHRFTRGRLWVLAMLALLLIAGHGFVLYSASKHLTVSAGFVAGVALLILLKHAGLVAPAVAWFRRYRRKR